MSNDELPCCAPSAPAATEHRIGSVDESEGVAPPMPLLDLAGGSFLMGCDDADGFVGDGEGPVREVEVSPFSISATTVTNADFAAFVDATAHMTVAESEGWSFVYGGLLPDEFEDTRGVAAAPWWRQVYGACWNSPEGPHSSVVDRGDHPVVHVSWFDAVAYCRWAGVRLPTEAEWEYAARGGLEQKRFPWGDELVVGGVRPCRIFDGEFPMPHPDIAPGTIAAGDLPPNGFGLHHAVGNVWEWCHDWFAVERDGSRLDPVGPPTGTAKVMRGGSYLCHDSYCNRYRVGARSSNTPDSTTGNLGFRVAH
ncbi:MAG TPA: formylglycine-generating enzyme family protein [Acidimicrobiales bacterium]|nr:formylglycine-generating enzyme family protein [Acidimicrobiales bacterium]